MFTSASCVLAGLGLGLAVWHAVKPNVMPLWPAVVALALAVLVGCLH